MQRLLFRWILGLLAFAPLLHAQTQEDDQAELEQARAKLAEVKDDATEDGKAWRSAYQERIKLHEELAETLRAKSGLPTAAELESRKTQAERQLREAKKKEVPSSLTLESPDDLGPYEQDSKAAKAAEVSAKSKLGAIKTRRSEAEKEMAGLSDRGSRASRRAEGYTEDDDITRYRKDSAELESRIVVERVSFLTAGLDIWKKEEEALEAEADLATADAKYKAALAKLAEDAADALRDAEAARAREEAERQERQAELERDPIQRFRFQIRAEAQKLAAETSSNESLTDDLEKEESAEKQRLEGVSADRDALDNRIRAKQKGVERTLRQNREQVRRQLRLAEDVDLPKLDDRFEKNQDRLAELLDRIWQVRLPKGENEELQALLAEVGEERHMEAEHAYYDAMLGEEGLLESLEELKNELTRAGTLYGRILEDLDKRIRALEEFEEYILARMLWTRSDTPIDGRSLKKVWTELRSLPEPYRKDGTWARVAENLRAHFMVPVAAIAFLVLLQFARRRLELWHEAGKTERSRYLLRIFGGLSWALVPPAQLSILAWSCAWVGAPVAFDPPVSDLLFYQAFFLAVRRLTRALLGKKGLIVGAQGFPTGIGMQVVRSVTLLTVFGQAFYAPAHVLAGKPFEFDVLPRLLETLWTLGAAMSVLLLVRRNGAIVQSWTLEGGFLRPILRFMSVFTTVSLVPLFALDLAGYRVGVHSTLRNSVKVFAALFLLGALYRVLDRIGAHWAGRVERAENEADAQALRARGAGVRAVARIGAYMIVVAMALILKETMGIGGVLSKLMVEVKLLEVDAETGRYVTAWDVSLAVLWVALGHILSSNLRMLADSLVNPFANADEGSTFAFLAISRYIILGVAYGGALLKLGFSFETLGWLATAASVGLGFGLQEIVANFISGLILLFERPIRVGDIVTIGPTSGRINSISMRATVITNWDRQTIIVPNKKFVTQDLTNWTRTDQVMRRELKIPVAYETEVKKVFELIHEILEAHPAVLKDPKPQVYCDTFGVIGLEFRVLFFTPISEGLEARSVLNTRIRERFRQEGIHIPTLERPKDMLPGVPQE